MRTETVVPDDDESLLTRLRDLALVDLDVLLDGVSGDDYARLLTSHGEDLEDALRQARTRAQALVAAIAGPDPLLLVDAPAAARARDGGRESGERVARRLLDRAMACRALARFDDLAGKLVPRLLEADRRGAGLPQG